LNEKCSSVWVGLNRQHAKGRMGWSVKICAERDIHTTTKARVGLDARCRRKAGDVGPPKGSEDDMSLSN
jgi:hypothetical protein